MADDQALPALHPAATVASPAQSTGSALPPLTPAPVSSGPGQLPPPIPAPVQGQSPSALPPPQAVPVADEEKTTNILDILQNHGHIMEGLERNASIATHQTFDPIKRALTSDGSFFGTNPAEKDLPGTENESWLKRKAAIMSQLSDKPILNLQLSSEERAAHPHESAFLDPVSQTISTLTTPKNLGFIASLGVAETLPKFFEAELTGAGLSAGTAAKFAKSVQTGLTALNAYFSADQIATALEKLPEVGQTLLRGEYDKSLGLITSAVINGALGGKAFHDTFQSLHSLVPESVAAKAMGHKDYADAVHEDQKTKQIGSARAEQLAELGRTTAANQLLREQMTEYVDAKGNRQVMAARQKETANPVTPEQRIAAQGKTIPLDDVKPNTEAPQTPKDVVESAGAVFRGQKGGMVELTLPPEMTKDLPLSEAMKHFVSVTLPETQVTPENVKAAMARKIQEYTPAEATNNASGESAASQEAVNRVQDEKAKGVVYERVDSRKPLAPGIPLTGVDAVDAKPGAFEHIVRTNPDGSQTIMSSGAKARPISTTSARPEEITAPKSATPETQNPEENPHDLSKTVQDAVSGNSFVAKGTAHQLGIAPEEEEAGGADKDKNTFVSPEVEKKQGLFSKDAIANAQKVGPATPEHWSSPAAQQTVEAAKAVARIEEAARAHVITPEERELLVKQQDPNFKMTKKQQDALNYARGKMREIGQRAVKTGVLRDDQLKDWFVPREADFEDASDPTKAQIFNSHHEGQMNGIRYKNKDYWALTSDYYRKMSNRIANSELITRLKTGRTSDGAPLAVGGGFVDGQRVSTEGPQSHVMGDDEVMRLKQKGQFAKLIDKGRIVGNPDGSYTMNTGDYVAAKNLFEVRPIGPTPIPPEIVKEMQGDGTLEKLQAKGLVYQNEAGEWMNKSQLYARVPVYVHPEIAEHMNEVVRAKSAQPTTAFGRVLAGYDDIQGKMKNMLLSWSPFHKATESWRMMESLGLLKGGALAARTNIASLPGGSAFLEKTGIGLPPKIDYFNLTPIQEAAIRDGIVVTDPRGLGPNNVEEGLSGGQDNFSYKLFDKSIGAGLEKIALKAGMTPEQANEIRRNINPQKILTDDVFGPHGMISSAKFELYADRKPLIAERIKSDHPEWSPEQVDAQAGRIAAQFANDKFGGLNYTLLGRALSTQKILRRLLLAPDFLESTGRSIVDVAGSHGSALAANFLRFNIAHLLTAAGINLAMHHNPDDKSMSGVLRDSHILDHPFGVVSPDNKSVYGLRTTTTDFIHMLNQPKEFMYNRVAPPLRAGVETLTQRNEYGRRESLGEVSKSIPKAMIPIQMQNAVGLGPNTTTEPTAGDQFLKSIGIQAKPNRTPAEQAAIDIVSQHLQGTEARTGQALVRSQLRFNAEDNLRAALQAQKAAKETGGDVAKAKERVDAANHAIDTLKERKLLGPDEVKHVRLAAQTSRLVSIFNSLDPKAALDVWDKANDDERVSLSPYMQQKYGHWREKIAKNGQNINQLDPDDQQMQDRFTQARIQANEAFRRPLPPPAPVKTKEPAKSTPKAPGEPSSEALPPLQPAPYIGQHTPKESDYAGLLGDASKKYGVDPTLMEAIMHRESLGNPGAESKKGAMGLMQLEPTTAKQYGVTDIKDPIQNIDAGTHYMADLLKEYDGDEKKALAAYNAGPTAVAQYGGIPPFKETKEYVKAVQEHKNSNYQNSTEFKPTEKDTAMFENWPKTGPDTAPGMVKPGNIDLTKRPVVHRADGSVSTLFSSNFGTDKGEVLVPLVDEKGKILTIEEARAKYKKDGKSLGVFKTPEQADEYADFLHKQQGKFQVWSNGGQYRPTVETHSDK